MKDLAHRVWRAKFHAERAGFPEQAEDFAQDAAVKLLQGRSTTVQNLFIDFLRENYGDPRHKRAHGERLNMIHATPVQDYQFDLDGDAPRYHPGALITEQTDAHILWQELLEGITGRDRAILTLYAQWGLHMREIAECFGVTETLISLRLKDLIYKLGKRHNDPHRSA